MGSDWRGVVMVVMIEVVMVMVAVVVVVIMVMMAVVVVVMLVVVVMVVIVVVVAAAAVVVAAVGLGRVGVYVALFATTTDNVCTYWLGSGLPLRPVVPPKRALLAVIVPYLSAAQIGVVPREYNSGPVSIDAYRVNFQARGARVQGRSRSAVQRKKNGYWFGFDSVLV